MWSAASHRRWRWYYNEELDCINEASADEVSIYTRVEGRQRTRSEQAYQLIGEVKEVESLDKPATVERKEDGTLVLMEVGSKQVEEKGDTASLWEFIRGHGGKWMWDEVESEDQDLTWLIAGLKQGSIIAVADGSYDRKKAPEVSGAGWVLCCTRSRKMLRGSFYEISASAS